MTTPRRAALLVSVLALLTGFATPATAETVVPAGFRPASTSWTGPGTGYVLGYAPCGTSWCPALPATTDGGTHWRRLGAPPMALPDNRNHVALTAESASVAYVDDGVHVRTTRDGGASWHPVALAGAHEPYFLSKITETGGRVFAVVTTYGEAHGATRLFSGAAGHAGLRRGVAVVRDDRGRGRRRRVPAQHGRRRPHLDDAGAVRPRAQPDRPGFPR